ncbi:MAG TPA: signal peptidase II [Candidatus Limnocylindrales bacterium]|nr:signal peptidase II [Candidatus Limnocylindrales bacterium]
MSSQASPNQVRAELLAMGVTAALILLVDQTTKVLVSLGIEVGGRVQVIGDLLVLWHVRNAGAAFSLFQGGQAFFLVVTVLAFGMLVWFHRSFRGRGLLLHVVLGLVLGGTLGNLLDRLRLGYVTDFVSVGIGDLRWPTWNVADASIVIGILALVGYLTFLDRPRGEARA